MNEHKTETIYRKVGRKYVPIAAQWYELDGDRMKTGTFRLTYAYEDGARRYEYDVTPATAPAVAAMMIAKREMAEAIQEASRMHPVTSRKYTKSELATIQEFRERMGGMLPTHWTGNTADQIADAAIKAVEEFRP